MARSREQMRFIAVERAKRRLQHRLDDIDWELQYLIPQVDGIAELEKTRHVVVELEPGDLSEDQD